MLVIRLHRNSRIEMVQKTDTNIWNTKLLLSSAPQGPSLLEMKNGWAVSNTPPLRHMEQV
jgi:hypothetical protein